MSLTDSPSFGDGSENVPLEEQPPSNQTPEPKLPVGRNRWTRIVIAVLFLAVLVTGLVFMLERTATSGIQVGSVTVIGQVVDSNGNPIPNAQVYVEGMDYAVTTDQSGNFAINGAPDGQVVVVVGVTPQPPHFEVVNAQENDTKDLGQIVVQLPS
jgi:Carboxypeptidase regulatory-like domain